jgi:transcriptional regulator with PAS, ATPase and Fis domain
MKNINLLDHKSTIQDTIEVFTSLSGLSMTIANNELVRVAGTGIHQDEIGDTLPESCVAEVCVHEGKPYIIKEAGQDRLCMSCNRKKTCYEKASLCVPIKYMDKTLGIIALVAENESQRNMLLKESDKYILVLNKICTILFPNLYDRVLLSEIKKNSYKVEDMVDAIQEGVIITDNNLNITGFNKTAKDYFYMKQISKNTPLTDVLPVDEKTIRDFLKGDIKQLEIHYGEEGRSAKYVCNSSVVKHNNKTEVMVFTFLPSLHKISLIQKCISTQYNAKSPIIIGKSKQLLMLKQLLKKTAVHSATVLLTGESGTGKELCARFIHRESERHNMPFIAVNCAAIPDNLVESELFGYEDGAFTGAKRGGKPGKFELADKGILFLDEISEIPTHIQVKLLRVLQDNEVTRVGGIKPYTVDIKIIAATNRDLTRLVEEGSFREDLYYRLNIIPVNLPSLRERVTDIPLLIEHFINRTNVKYLKNIYEVEPRLLDLMKSYKWPGNVRELENVIEYGVCITDGHCLMYDCIAPRLRINRDNCAALNNRILTCEEYEKTLITTLLTKKGSGVEGKRSIAVELGISQATLYRKIKKYGLHGISDK